MFFIIRIVAYVTAYRVNFRIDKVFTGGNRQDLVAVFLAQELAFAVQQFQGVPLPGIMACRYYNTSIGTRHSDSKFRSRCCSQAYVNNIKT